MLICDQQWWLTESSEDGEHFSAIKYFWIQVCTPSRNAAARIIDYSIVYTSLFYALGNRKLHLTHCSIYFMVEGRNWACASPRSACIHLSTGQSFTDHGFCASVTAVREAVSTRCDCNDNLLNGQLSNMQGIKTVAKKSRGKHGRRPEGVAVIMGCQRTAPWWGDIPGRENSGCKGCRLRAGLSGEAA